MTNKTSCQEGDMSASQRRQRKNVLGGDFKMGRAYGFEKLKVGHCY